MSPRYPVTTKLSLSPLDVLLDPICKQHLPPLLGIIRLRLLEDEIQEHGYEGRDDLRGLHDQDDGIEEALKAGIISRVGEDV